MGRPPLGKRAMTATEAQRRWRKRKRLGLVGTKSEIATAVAKADQPEPPKAAHVPLLREPPTVQIEELMRQLEIAQGTAQPKLAVPDDPGRCFLCLEQRPVMVKIARRYFTLILCDGCIGELHENIAARAL
jgi:hypothetical protein